MTRYRLSILAFASLLTVSGGFAINIDEDPNFDSVSPEIKEVCVKALKFPVPAADKPDAATKKALKDCDAEALYYGFSDAPDFVKARQCAFTGNEFPHVLAMIYANGKGVKQNLDLALRFACEMGGAPAEIEGRVKHLEEIREKKDPNPNFDYCDDITSGLMSGYCTKKSARFTEAKRNTELKALVDKWTPEEKAAFSTLQKASEAFTEARGTNEVDLSGTARAAFVIEEESIQKKDFLESLQKLQSGKAPHYTAAQAKDEDAKLNALYKQIQGMKHPFLGTVTADGVKKAQKAWLKYRDAWIAFAKLKFPNYSSESISAWFTKKRNHMLRSLLKG